MERRDGAWLAVAATADKVTAAVICQRRSGALVVRAACKRKETALNLADFGAVGPPGVQGPAGSLLDTLPSGRSLQGAWAVSGTATGVNDGAESVVTFPIPLGFTPIAHVITGGTPPAECPGNVTTPQAVAGHLCVYQGGQFANAGPIVADPAMQGGAGVVRRWGFRIIDTPGLGGHRVRLRELGRLGREGSVGETRLPFEGPCLARHFHVRWGFGSAARETAAHQTSRRCARFIETRWPRSGTWRHPRSFSRPTCRCCAALLGMVVVASVLTHGRAARSPASTATSCRSGPLPTMRLAGPPGCRRTSSTFRWS